jgi:hypothetical protein
MARRGRPRKNGEQPMWMLERAALAVHGYDEARKAGEKHMAAITCAVQLIRATHPEMKASETEVKRVLADWRSNRRPTGLWVTKPDPADCMLTLPDGRVVRRLLDAGFGPRPVYPRANAAAKPRKGRNPAPQP